MFAAVARFWWVIVPAIIARVFPSAAATLADGVELCGVPIIGALAPLVAIALGFGCSRLLPSGDFVYTGSLLATSIMLALGCVGGGIGAWALLGFIAGDLTGGHHFTLMQSHWGPFALAISYMLLGLLAISVPRAARMIARASLPTKWSMAASIAAVLLAAGFAYLWSQAAPVLIRPNWIFIGTIPDAAQIAPVQQHGYVLVVVALVAMALTEWLRIVWRARSQLMLRESYLARARVRSLSAPWPLTAVLQAALMTFFISGALSTPWEGLGMFAILAVGYGLNRWIGTVKGYALIASRIPFVLRFIVAVAAAFFLAWLIVLPLFGTTESFEPLLYTAGAALIVTALLFPRSRRAATLAVFALIASWPALALADNCDGLSDCFSAGQWALIAAVAVAAVVAGGFLIAAAAAAEVAAGAEAAAVAAEAAEAAGALGEAGVVGAEAGETAVAAGEAGVAGAEAGETGVVAAEAGEAGAADAAAADAAEAGAADAAASDAAAADASASDAAAADAAAAGETGGVGPISDLGLPDVNAIGGADNCAQCAQAIENALGGEGLPQYAADIGPSDATMGDLAAQNGSSWSGETNFGDIGNYLEGAGDGSRGIVYVSETDAEGVTTAHVFNAINSGGDIIAIDGQTGVYGSIGDVAGYSGYTNPGSVLFLPTFP